MHFFLGRLKQGKMPRDSRTTLHFWNSLEGSCFGLLRSPNGKRIREVSNARKYTVLKLRHV
jgi:hypothetical protein